MPAIERIKHIDDATLVPKHFIEAINQDIDKLNGLITDYNCSVNHDVSISILKEILRSIQLIENTYSDKYISNCSDFTESVQVKLFSEIQAEFAKHGISDLYGILTPDSPPPNKYLFIYSSEYAPRTSESFNVYIVQGFAL